MIRVVGHKHSALVDYHIAKFAFESSHELARQLYIVCYFTECAGIALKPA